MLKRGLFSHPYYTEDCNPSCPGLESKLFQVQVKGWGCSSRKRKMRGHRLWKFLVGGLKSLHAQDRSHVLCPHQLCNDNRWAEALGVKIFGWPWKNIKQWAHLMTQLDALGIRAFSGPGRLKLKGAGPHVSLGSKQGSYSGRGCSFSFPTKIHWSSKLREGATIYLGVPLCLLRSQEL